MTEDNMNKKSHHQYRIITWLLTSMILLLVVGCGPFKTLLADQSKYDAKNHTARPNELQDAFLLETANRFGLMALFAETVYRRDLADDLKDSAGCNYLQQAPEDVSRPYHGMPQGKDGAWSRWRPEPALPNGVLPCFSGSGLYYETYIFTDSNGIVTEAVIAFRGTENRRGQYFHDWGSNFAAAFAFEPKQYELASGYVPDLIKGLQDEFNNDNNKIQIYATGHSLGGGLAQQAGYLSSDIVEVFTFNTTPVTNWSSLRMRGAVKKAYPVIHRIYHGGEFLEKIRFVSTSLTKARYGRHDIGLQFDEEKRSLFSGHDMKIIACNFARLISIQSPIHEADHHYPAEFITQNVLVKGAPPPDPKIDTAICRFDEKADKDPKVPAL
jgi:hypothetical protein